MATFRVGDKVRKIAPPIDGVNHVPMGAEGVITGPGLPMSTGVTYYEASFGPRLTGMNMAEFQLAPLTDPKADEFIERVKKWKPEPEVVLTPEDRLMQRNEQYAP